MALISGCPVNIHAGLIAMFDLSAIRRLPEGMERKRVKLSIGLASEFECDRNITVGKLLELAREYQEPRIACWDKIPFKILENYGGSADSTKIWIPIRFARALKTPQVMTYGEYLGTMHAYQKMSSDRYLLTTPKRAMRSAIANSYFELFMGGILSIGLSMVLMYGMLNADSEVGLPMRMLILGVPLAASLLAFLNGAHNKLINIPKSWLAYKWLAGIDQ